MSSAWPDTSDLIQIVNAALASAVARSGPHLACRPGCAQCCHGVFEITALDAERLREGLAQLTENSPTRAAEVKTRLTAARAHLEPWFPGDLVTGVLTGTPQAVELFEEFANVDPCPLLDPATQTCDLYEHRPILCRTFGPPIRNDHGDPAAGLAICELCFTDATEDQIASAEMDSGFRPLEEQLETAYRTSHPQAGPTIVAFAFSSGETDTACAPFPALSTR